ncbi:MAG: GDP-L-fucose synthase [Candidatus Moranbacteria bacterium]|nr:GDP-L-fucose synthase [Candidatus Moranbacteria bacterium]
MRKDSKIYVAGHRGLVGSAITRKLQSEGFANLLFRSIDELNLMDTVAVNDFFRSEKPEYVFLAAAKVGGILANDTYPADFIYQNLAIQNNVIHAAYEHNAKKLLFLGSSCIYPRDCPQPIREDSLLTGPLEKTNEAYAIAKIAGIKTCQAFNKQFGTRFISVMPTNLYGPNDNFDLESSHVLPALIRKFHDAKLSGASEVVMWGTGSPKREFLHVDDLADACIFLMNTYDESEIVNIGTGEDVTIRQLVELIRDIVGFKGQVVNDTTKPDGTPRKLLDVSYLHSLGWKHSVTLKEGIQKTYEWYLTSRK